MPSQPAYFYRQSAVLPYREHQGKLEILMITNRRRRRWVIPKGIQEPHLTPAASAANEALEEAGIQGLISEMPIGYYDYKKWGGTCVVVVFVMKVTTLLEQWQEDFRDRAWLSIPEAANRAREIKLKALMRALPNFLAQEGEPT